MIDLATLNDLSKIMHFLTEIKKEMRNSNNPQWGLIKENNPNILEEYLDYPNEEIIKQDINNKNLYCYKEDDLIKGIIVISKDEREYDEVITNSLEPAYIVHRLAIPIKYRHLGIAYKLMEYASQKAKEDNIKVLKGDTEISNDKMNNLFLKMGYSYIGKFKYNDYPGEYNYYEKKL